MKTTVVDEPDLTLPEDSIHQARLEEVKEKTIKWNDKETGDPKESEILEWWWKITRSPLGEEYEGRKVRGECSPKMTNRGNNRYRLWYEAVAGKELTVGQVIDTDDLIGLEAEIVIGHKPNRQDPSRPWETVSDVIPLNPFNQDGPPPF